MERKLYRRSGCDHTGSDMDDGSSYVNRNRYVALSKWGA